MEGMVEYQQLEENQLHSLI